MAFNEIPFDKTYLNTNTIKISQTDYLDEIPPVQGINEAESDFTSTHPNIFKRKKQIQELAITKQNRGMQTYIVSETMFKKMQQTMRFELPTIQLHNGLYQDALYSAFLLKKLYNADKYADLITVKALYFLAKYNSDVKMDNTFVIKHWTQARSYARQHI